MENDLSAEKQSSQEVKIIYVKSCDRILTKNNVRSVVSTRLPYLFEIQS
jgi:hypothetical protein